MSNVNVDLNEEEKWLKTCYASLTDVTKENEKKARKKSIVQMIYSLEMSTSTENVVESFLFQRLK